MAPLLSRSSSCLPARGNLSRFPAVTNAVPAQSVAKPAALGTPYRGDRNVLLREEPGSDTLLITFAGLGLNGVELITTVQRYARGVHFVFVRDPRRILYMLGIPPVWPGLEQAARGLTAMAQDLGARRVLCFGASAGAFAAIRYGYEIGVDAVLAMAGPTSITREAQTHDARALVMSHRLDREIPNRREDLGDLLRSRVPALPVTLYVGETMPEDSYHALHMAGVPEFVLVPLKGLGEHGVAQHLDARGALQPIVEAFVQGTLTRQLAAELAEAGHRADNGEQNGMRDPTAEVLEILASKIRGRGSELQLTDKLGDLGIDSLDTVETITDLEDRFGIQIPLNISELNKLDTVGDVVRAITPLIVQLKPSPTG
jgi:acyl carrier protein